MRTLLYGIWFLFPAFFFVMAFWSYLEKISNKHKKENPGDFLSQGIFVLICVAICIIIDQFALESFWQSLLSDYVPLGFLQILLLPAVLYIGAMLIGPSKAILIDRAPRPTRGKPPRKRR